ncbi:hypothetical protein HELRODRAFT_91406 [Helobdella robusta]|uniref:Thioredoxin domain-containing protein n=1 Tax=Helobdella robusta TaxID=6412 RepID=T1G833_HELRO|nr:hypothetical protein HELRODRAFT_91406 [Helobdella robusta]ESO11436.1 hypothetical protein HELRODRAFT_91406 [Helobdella robusta]
MNYSIVTALFCLICHSYNNSPFLAAAQKARSSSSSRLCGHEEVELTDENWRQTLSGKWMIKFYAPWCPACQSMDEDWVKLARKLRHHGYCVGSANVAENAGLSGRFLVTSLPTVYHAIDGKFRLYDGVRATDEFEKFIVESKWSDVEPVAWYLSPTSYHMATLGSFFTFSMFLKDVHVMLTDDFGLPNYLSYAMFAIVTILIGLIIGLVSDDDDDDDP